MYPIKKILYTEEEIEAKTKELAKEISKNYEEVLIVGILKGAVPFMASLCKKIESKVYMDYMDVSTYQGVTTTGEVRILKDLDFQVEGRDVLIVEDIIDTGLTLSYLMELLKKRGAKSIEICSLLTKPERRRKNVEVKYIGFEIEDNFVVGYGMDYNEEFRNLPYIGILDENYYK